MLTAPIIPPHELKRLQDLTERVIGELPFSVMEVSCQDGNFIFLLEHVTDGIWSFPLPLQIMDLTNGVLRLLIDQEIIHILDILWGRVDLDN